ncbi:unnamed protein product [Clavelina lepadiformis]|uniref:protein-serine/threonine phosphatase n=1 Tax=Clavelina lepadiformis TaxID=159417 RepID=A0ABP0G3U3_CLALP
MCSCAVAFPSFSPAQQYIHQQVLRKRYRTGSTDNLLHETNLPLRVVASAPPSLGVLPTPTSLSIASSWTSRIHHYDVAVKTLLTKHECQFKLSQGELQAHLHAIFHHLRPQDSIKLAVRLESWDEDHRRFLVIISTQGRQDTEESIIVGCDFTSKESKSCTIGLVLPIWRSTNIKLDGDGGFKIKCDQNIHTFKPISVQAMWSALQSLHRCLDVAQRHNYYEGSLFLTWIGYYTSKLDSTRSYIQEWNYREDLFNTGNFQEKTDPGRAPVEALIRAKLKEVMMEMNLDDCTSRDIRNAIEREIDMDLRGYKAYIDTEMLTVLGQMDCASKISDYLYLGSEWNACNLEELEEFGITHILNVTLEIENFFPRQFDYKSIRLRDVETSDLLSHWNATWRYISEARKKGGRVLVHCKMGISRSAATVCAFLMKENSWNHERALEYVESCRSIVNPNSGFRKQLVEYEGILIASAHRHNRLFRTRSESSLSDPSITESDHHPIVMSPRAPPLLLLPDENDNEVAKVTTDFDLNRHLLDITSLAVPKVSRPKSWSPDEGRTCYNSNNFINAPLPVSEHTHTHEGFRKGRRTLNASEPGEILLSIIADPDLSEKARAKRKNFTDKRAHMRRYTASANPAGDAAYHLDELAHSEDSVFVHDGTEPGNPSALPRGAKRVSSPAAISCELVSRPDLLPISSNPPHPSVPSPMQSPSYKNAMNVDIGLLKSKFSTSSCELMEGITNPEDSFTTIDEAAEASDLPIKASVPVREIVAVIESPTEDLTKVHDGSGSSEESESSFVKGHHKTMSLPPANFAPVPVTPPRNDKDLLSRSRSYSEAQAKALSVKKIVTEIESRYGSDATSEEAKPGDVTIHRTMSMPNTRRKIGSPCVPTCVFVPVREALCEVDDVVSEQPEAQAKSCFFIGDSQPAFSAPDVAPCCGVTSNNNNNNNNVTMETMAAERWSPDTNDDVTMVSESAVGMTRIKKESSFEERLETIDEMQIHKRAPALSQEELQIIREVGMQLMSDSDDTSLTSSTRHNCDELEDVTSSQTSKQSTPFKKPGLVRQMAREIEKRVRKLTGRRPKSSATKSHKVSEPLPVPHLASPTTVINKLLMGESNIHDTDDRRKSFPRAVNQSPSPTAGSLSPDNRVRDLVDRFDSSVEHSPASSPIKKLSCDFSSPIASSLHISPRKSATDIVSLVTAAPYRPPEGSKVLSSSPSALSKHHLSLTSAGVRRSQSERIGRQSHQGTGFYKSPSTRGGKYLPRVRSYKSQPDLWKQGQTTPVFLNDSSPGGMMGGNVQSSLGNCSSFVQDVEEPPFSSPLPVRAMVKNIEEVSSGSSSSVHRSASMPPSSPRRPKTPLTPTKSTKPSISSLFPVTRTLSRSKSTPLLGFIKSAQLLHPTHNLAPRKDKSTRTLR